MRGQRHLQLPVLDGRLPARVQPHAVGPPRRAGGEGARKAAQETRDLRPIRGRQRRRRQRRRRGVRQRARRAPQEDHASRTRDELHHALLRTPHDGRDGPRVVGGLLPEGLGEHVGRDLHADDLPDADALRVRGGRRQDVQAELLRVRLRARSVSPDARRDGQVLDAHTEAEAQREERRIARRGRSEDEGLPDVLPGHLARRDDEGVRRGAALHAAQPGLHRPRRAQRFQRQQPLRRAGAARTGCRRTERSRRGDRRILEPRQASEGETSAKEDNDLGRRLEEQRRPTDGG